MRLACGFAILGLSLGLLALANAQPPRERPEKKAAKDDKANTPDAKRIVERMMAFDKNKDGKLEKEEITDPRLMRLFERADANKDGVVTKEELTKMAERMSEGNDERPGRFGPGDGPPGGPPGGPGGPPGGRGRFGSGAFGPPAPGQLLPAFLQERLKLTAEQKKQLDDLQKEIDGKLAKILTEEQKKQLKEMSRGFGPPRGPGGPPGRGPGGPPREDGDGPPPSPQ